MLLSPPLALGLDFGSHSARAVIFNCDNGDLRGAGISPYAAGRAGVFTDPADPNVARQSPAAYITALTEAVRTAINVSDADPSQIASIGIGTTGSTPLPVDSELRPLADQDPFKDDLNAQAWMWKDHTSFAEAEEITAAIHSAGLPYLSQSGGAYSSEWFWAKILRCARTAPNVFSAAHTWLELQDFIPAVLCGIKDNADLKRGICAAGHKGLFAAEWGGLPNADFLKQLHPGLSDLRARLYETAYASDQIAGSLSDEWAGRLGLNSGIPVAVACLDAHAGAIGAGVREGVIVKIMGTSTCDIGVSATPAGDLQSEGLCGAIDSSVLPGLTGLEAGQSAVGDLFEWGARLFSSDGNPLSTSFASLTTKAEALAPGESGLIALDWNNGNRSILMDARLSGLLVGQSLQTQPHEIFRALIEATAFGGRIILDQFEKVGAAAKEVVICGGVATKSGLVRQIYADVLARPIRLDASDNASVLGAAMLGAVAAGSHADMTSAQGAMIKPSNAITEPIAANVKVYAELFALYRNLHDGFASNSPPADFAHLMKSLLAIRDRVRSRS